MQQEMYCAEEKKWIDLKSNAASFRNLADKLSEQTDIILIYSDWRCDSTVEVVSRWFH